MTGLTVIALRAIEDGLGFVVMGTMVTCTVGCLDLAGAFEGSTVVPYCENRLRL